jgi:hypothetical protein
MEMLVKLKECAALTTSDSKFEDVIGTSNNAENHLALVETIVRRWFKRAAKKSFLETPPMGLYSCVIIVHELFSEMILTSASEVDVDQRIATMYSKIHRHFTSIYEKLDTVSKSSSEINGQVLARILRLIGITCTEEQGIAFCTFYLYMFIFPLMHEID